MGTLLSTILHKILLNKSWICKSNEYAHLLHPWSLPTFLVDMSPMSRYDTTANPVAAKAATDELIDF